MATMIAPGPLQPTQYLFIDGGYLRGELDSIGARVFKKSLKINHAELSEGYLRTFYYDGTPERRSGEDESDWTLRKDAFDKHLSILRLLDGFHVYEGAVRGMGRKLKQKGVDVMIAVHMLSHTVRGNMQKVTLIAGDLDFLPVIDALVDLGMYVTVWSNPKTTAKELMEHADRHHQLTLRELLQYVPPTYWDAATPRPIIDIGSKRSLFDEVGKSKRTADGEAVIVTRGKAAGFVDPLSFEVCSVRPDGKNPWWMVRHPNEDVAIAAGREVFGDFVWPPPASG